MFLDKTLLLKGVAGVAAVGGVVGGGFAVQKAGLFSSSSNAGDDQPGATNPATIEEDYGIPKRCNDSPNTPCELTQDELKKIKFEVLGEGDTPAVTVENFPEEGKKISLTIDSTDSTRKKYIFSNTSTQDVIVKRDESKKVTLKAGKTKFTLSGSKLKEKELGEYGEPKDCTSTCSLTPSDLEDIKFKDLDQGTGDITVTPTTGTVSLEIKTVGDTKRFIFTASSQEVVIKKGEDKKITFTSNKKTQFTADSDKKLNKVILDNYGVPTTCTSSCTLTADDLGEIKFEELDGTGTVSSGAGNVTLKVDSSDTTNKRFTFENSGSPITITKPSETSKSITLSTGKTRFKGGSDKLKKIVVDDKGLPSDCGNSCKLTAEDLGEIKFKALDSGTGTVSPTNQTVTLTVESSPSKKYKFNNTGGEITIKKGDDNSKVVTLKASGDTEFTEENNALNLVEPPEANGVPGRCKNTTPCTLTTDELKNIKFKAYGDTEEGTVSIEPDPSSSTINLSITTTSGSNPKIYKFNNSGSSAITLKKGNGPNNSVVLEKGETEFKDENSKLVVYEEESLKSVNEKIVNTLKLPKTCKFKNSEKDKFTKECEVTKEDLKTVNFENKESSDLTVNTSITGNIKLGIRRLKNSNEDDKEQYGSNIKDDDLKITFKDTSSKITIGSGNNTITIPAKSNMEFLLNTDNKLIKSYKGLTGLPNSWAISCSKDNSQGSNKYNCTPVGTSTKIRFFTDFSSGTYQELQISNGDESKKIFIAEEDVDNYSQGYKFTVNEAITASGSSPSLTANDNYEIKYSTEKKKWGYVKKTTH